MRYLILLLVLLVVSCSDEQGAYDLLRSQGYTEITITGIEYGACSKDDFYSTGFSALNSNNRVVIGVVCRGFFKGSTVRFR